MIQHLTTHSEIYGNKHVINELMADQTTGENITWGVQPSYIQRVAAHEFIKYQDLKRIARGHNRNVHYPLPSNYRYFINAGIPEELLNPNYVSDGSRKTITHEVSFLRKKWMEADCAEGFTLATVYAPASGRILPVNERTGFIDIKLNLISRLCDSPDAWIILARYAVGSCYGFEVNGDNLFLTRINVLSSILDFFKNKFDSPLNFQEVEEFANIISWNIFQLDGYTHSIPHFILKDKSIAYAPIVEPSDSKHSAVPHIYDWERKGVSQLQELAKILKQNK